MSITVVIPTLNEAKHLTRLLNQLVPLQDRLTSIIVSDGGSEDETVSIARGFGVEIVKKAQPHTIAAGRNLGARCAEGDILMFCDADVALHDPQTFIETVDRVFRDDRVVAGIPRLEVFPSERNWKDAVFHGLFNPFLRLSFGLRMPFSFGQCQIIRRSAFEEVGGYDERRAYAEDSAIVKQLQQVGRLHFFYDLLVYESPRRYRKYGYPRLIAVALFSVVGQALLRRNIVKKWTRVD